MVTTTTNAASLLVPSYGGGREHKMPYTEKATKFFRARAHGFEPDRFDTNLSPAKAKELLAHETQKVEARARGQKRALEKL